MIGAMREVVEGKGDGSAWQDRGTLARHMARV